MASLSSSRKAEPRRFLTLGLACVAGLGHASFALTAAPVAAQDAVQDDGAGNEPVAQVVPEPAPVPFSLDELIPETAVADPENWAADGVANPVADVGVVSFPPDPASPLLDPALPGLDPALTPELDAVFADFAVDVPAPLEPDAALEALASITAPVLGDLPELEETRVGSTLVLALPAAEDAFPERREFVQRFRDLSTLRQLDDGEESAPQVAARARSDE